MKNLIHFIDNMKVLDLNPGRTEVAWDFKDCHVNVTVSEKIMTVVLCSGDVGHFSELIQALSRSFVLTFEEKKCADFIAKSN